MEGTATFFFPYTIYNVFDPSEFPLAPNFSKLFLAAIPGAADFLFPSWVFSWAQGF